MTESPTPYRAAPIYGPRLAALSRELQAGADPEAIWRMMLAVSDAVTRHEQAHLKLREAAHELVGLVRAGELAATIARLESATDRAVRPVDGTEVLP
jgi:hypothetical protein